MKFFNAAALAAFSFATTSLAASSWSFEDATLTVQEKGAGVGGGVKEKYVGDNACVTTWSLSNKSPRRLSPTSALSSAVTLAAGDSLKVALTTTEGRSGKRPHQAFLSLSEQETGLQDSFGFSVKETGKGKLDIVRNSHQYRRILSLLTDL